MEKITAIIKALEYARENYEVLTDENVGLDCITSWERMLEKFWECDEITEEEINKITEIIGLMK